MTWELLESPAKNTLEKKIAQISVSAQILVIVLIKAFQIKVEMISFYGKKISFLNTLLHAEAHKTGAYTCFL